MFKAILVWTILRCFEENKKHAKNKNAICSVWAWKSRTKSCEFQHLDHSSYGKRLVLVFWFSKIWGTRKDKIQKKHKNIKSSINFERNVHFLDGSLWSRRFRCRWKYNDPKNISFICKAISLYTQGSKIAVFLSLAAYLSMSKGAIFGKIVQISDSRDEGGF